MTTTTPTAISTTTTTTTTTIFIVSLTAMTGFFGCVSSKTKTKVEVCNRETQLLNCGGNDVIIIDSARNGRMSEGRCLTSSQHLNCSADVTPYLEYKCAGRRQCSVSFDVTLDNSPHGCHQDLKIYLEILYSCIPVETPRTTSCQDNLYVIKPTEPSGYLARVATIETGIGSSSCPWVIEVKSGQTLSLTLLDFGIWRLSNQSGDGRSVCLIYMTVKDRIGSGSSVRICGGTKAGERRRDSFFTSVTNSVQIAMNQGDDQFIVKYEVIGCPDLNPTPSHSSVERNGNELTIRCEGRRGGGGGGGGGGGPEGVTLTCVDGNWTGPPLVNCSAFLRERGEGAGSTEAQSSLGGVLTVVVVAAVVVVVILVATVAIFVWWRHRLLKQRSEEIAGTSLPLTEGYPCVPAAAYFDPAVFPGSHYALTPTTAPAMPPGGGLRLLHDGSRRPSADLLHQLDYSTLQASQGTRRHHPGALPKNLGHSASFSSFRQLPGVVACAEAPYNGVNAAAMLMFCPYHGTITRLPAGSHPPHHDPRGPGPGPGGCAAHPLSHSHEGVMDRCGYDDDDDGNQFPQPDIYQELDPHLLSPDPRC